MSRFRVIRRGAACLALLVAVVALVAGVPATAVAAPPGPSLSQAYELLLDTPARIVGAGPLATAAWNATVTHLRRTNQLPARFGSPQFVDERGADWQAFLAAYDQFGVGDRTALDQAIIRGMAAVFDDAHTFYLAPGTASRSQAEQRGDYGRQGLGFSLGPDTRTVTDVPPQGPAALAGVQRGDRLVAIDGMSLATLTPGQLTASLAPAPGVSRRVTVVRFGEPEARELVVTSGSYQAPWVSAEVLPGDLGYLRVRRFEFLSGPTGLERRELLNEAIDRLQRREVRGLVVDLRDNPGGSVQTGNLVLQRLIASGVLYQTVDRAGVTRAVRATGGGGLPGTVPITVLIDARSASMAEVVAAALHDTAGATVIGERSRGAVAFGSTFNLADGSALSITVSLVLSPNGSALDKRGVTPNQFVGFDLGLLHERIDTQLEAGLRALERQRMLSRAA